MNRRIKMKKLKRVNAYLKELLKYAKVPQLTPALPSVATLVAAYYHDGFMPESMISELLARELVNEVRKYMVIEGPEYTEDSEDSLKQDYALYRGVIKVVIPETKEV